MARVLHLVIASLGALAGVSCFSIAPLADCTSQDGLYVPFHVCMPLARPPLQLTRAPIDMAVGNFDGDYLLDDLAILSEPDHVTVFTALDRDTPPQRELAFTGGAEAVQGFLATPFFDGGVHGDDLFAWVARSPPALSQIVALPNGGDNFAVAMASAAGVTKPVRAPARLPARQQRPAQRPDRPPLLRAQRRPRAREPAR